MLPGTSSRKRIQKQIALYVSVDDWRRLRAQAARLNRSIADLTREWVQPHIALLPPETTRAA